ESRVALHGLLDGIPDGAPWKLAPGSAAWLMKRPHVVAVDELDARLGQHCDVLVPRWMRCMGGIDSRKDDHGWPSGTDGFADLGEGLVVGDGKGEFGNGVGGRRYDGVAVNRWMWAVLSR